MALPDTIKNSRTFLEECWVELQKVTWPDREQLQNATLVVLLFTIAISIIIWVMDAAVRVIIDQIMGVFGA